MLYLPLHLEATNAEAAQVRLVQSGHQSTRAVWATSENVMRSRLDEPEFLNVVL